jgi:hypothetical protein
MYPVSKPSNPVLYPTPTRYGPVQSIPFSSPTNTVPKNPVLLITTDLGSPNDTAAANNPLRGFAVNPDWTYPYLTAIPCSLEFYYIGLNKVMTANNTFNWNAYLEPKLTATANRGKHAILRFFLDYPQEPTGVPDYLIQAGLTFSTYTAYGGGKSPNYSDTNLLYALKTFITALGAKYDNDNRIGFIQLGLLGFWGEWHTYTNKDEGWIPMSTKTSVVSWFRAAFQKTQLLMTEDIGLSDIGLHDDSFAYETIDGAANGGVLEDYFFWSKVKRYVCFIDVYFQMYSNVLSSG